MGQKIPSRTMRQQSCTQRAIISALFNPIDRALYLSVINHRPFLRKINFVHPYQGFMQSAVQRVISGGLYFFLQGEISSHVLTSFELTDIQRSIALGTLAGSLNGMILNQLAAVKYYAWTKGDYALRQATREMFREGGIRPFFKGIFMTTYRDVVFGISYELLRTWNREFLANVLGRRYNESAVDVISINLHGKGLLFVCNFVAALFATVFSAPFNYARNIEYGSSAQNRSPGFFRIMKSLSEEAKKESKIFWKRAVFVGRSFRLGWGSARVGVGMAIGQYFFEVVRSGLKLHYHE